MALVCCVLWLRVVVSKPGPGEPQPNVLFVAALESLVLSINLLLSCFTFGLIRRQAAGPPADGAGPDQSLGFVRAPPNVRGPVEG